MLHASKFRNTVIKNCQRTTLQLRLDKAVRNLTCCDLEIQLEVVCLSETGLKKTGFLYLDLLGGRGGKGEIGCVV